MQCLFGVVLNACAMEVSYLANSFYICMFGSDKQHKKSCKRKRGKTPGYKDSTIAYVMFWH